MDALKDLAYSTVLTPPSPAASGTDVILQAGHGSRFPAAPFDVTIWAANELPTLDNAEIARCTAKATDTLTLTRAQYGTNARTIVEGDNIAQTITANLLEELQAAIDDVGLGLSGAFRRATVTLTAAQINAANVTPITIAAAQAGKILRPVGITAKAIIDTNFTSNVDFSLVWDGHTTNHLAAAFTMNLFSGAGTTVHRTGVMSGVFPGATSSFDPTNKALQIKAGGASTGGGATTVEFILLYEVVEF